MAEKKWKLKVGYCPDTKRFEREKMVPRSVSLDGIEACRGCGSREYLYNEDGNRNQFCGQCGQAIEWSEEGQ